MGRFGKRTQDGHACEQDGFRVSIGHELWRDRKADRLCLGTRRSPDTGKRVLDKCLLERHGKEWVPLHRPRLDESCRMTDSDGTVLGYLGEPTEDGMRCRYAIEKDNGAYGKYTRYGEQPIGEEFHTDAARTAVCLDLEMRQCFMRPPAGRHTLAWGNDTRAATALVGGFEGGLKEQAADAQDAARAVRDVATGKTKLTTIYEEGKQAATTAFQGAVDAVKDPEKRKAAITAARNLVHRLEDAVVDWSRKPAEEQMEDVLGAAGEGGAYMATGMAAGGVGRLTGEGAVAVAGKGGKVVATAGRGGKTASPIATGTKAQRRAARAVAQAAGEQEVALSSRPPNLSPEGAGRRGAFRMAKKKNGIPMSQHPDQVGPNVDRNGNVQPGRTYKFNVQSEGHKRNEVILREDKAGHHYGPDNVQNRGPHFNDGADNHYDY